MFHDSMPRRDWARVGMIIAGVVCALGGADNAFAQAHPLFSLSQEVREPAIRSEDPLDGAERRLLKAAGHVAEPEPAEVVRHRIARIDLAHLDALREALGGEREGLAPRLEKPENISGLRLNLFDDAAFDLMDIDISATPRGFTFSAAVKGSLFGTATLAVNGDVVSGLVRVQRGIYTVRSVGGGRVAIRQVKPTSPDLATPLPPSVGVPRTGFVHKEAVVDEGDAVVDVLVLWSPAAREEAGGQREIETIVDHLVAVANRAYADSGAHVRFNVAHMQEVDAEDDGGLGLWHPLTGAPSLLDHRDIRQTALRLRDVVGADLIHFLGSGAGCRGIATKPISLPHAHDAIISMSKQACVINGWDLVFAHELTHNFGVSHDRYTDLRDNWPPKLHPYAHGYVNQAAFLPDAPESAMWLTLMAYDDQCGSLRADCAWLPRLSSPTQTHLGDPLGVAGDAETRTVHGPADARRVVNEMHTVVAGYRPPRANLAVTASLDNQALAEGQGISLQVRLRNLGRVGSADITLRVYRSVDAAASDDDHLIRTVALAPLGAAAEAPAMEVESDAPTEPGTYHYIACVEDALAAVPCSVLPVTVGPTVSVGAVTALEGQVLAFPVELSASLPTEMVVAYAVEGNTAAPEVDFRAPRHGELTIPAGATTATIDVNTIDDDVAEPSDTIKITLTGATPAAPDGAVLSVTSQVATGSIRDDDGDLNIPDRNLRKNFAAALGKDQSDVITADEIATVTELTVGNLRDLTGIQFASGLRELYVDNGSFDGGSVGNLDLSPLAHLPKMISLKIRRAGVDDIRPLRYLTNLRLLELTGNQIDDLTPLSQLVDLRELYINENRVSDLAPLSRLTRLRQLDAERNEISTLSGLENLTSLWILTLNGNPVSDVTPIANLSLRWLDLSGTKSPDLSPIRDNDSLRIFVATNAQLHDVSALEGWAVCGSLWLRGNAISDVSPLARMPRLRALDLSHNQISDVAPLAGADLTALYLDFNQIHDISSLAGLESLRVLSLKGNDIVDVEPLSALTFLRRLDLGGNEITDVSALAGLISLTHLQMAGNRISDIESLAGLLRLSSLDISNNSVADISVLHSLPELHEVYLHSNPLTDSHLAKHIARLHDRHVSVHRVVALATDASAKEGERLAVTARLTGVASGEAIVRWDALARREDRVRNVALNGRQVELDVEPTAAAADFAVDPFIAHFGVTIPAGSTEVTTSSFVQLLDDMRKEPHEVLVLELGGAAYKLPHDVTLPLPREGWTNVRISQSVGLIVDPEGPFHDVPLFPSAGGQRQAFVRVLNGGRRSAAHVEAFAEDGTEASPATLALQSGGAAHFNSGDLEDGNWDKGLGRGIGPGQGDWRLRLWGNDLQVLSYIRTADGFLTSMHDVVPRDADGRYRAPTFNPASNWRQESRLRLANAGGEMAAIEIFGVDDAGARAGPVRLQLEGGMSRTLTARQLESGEGLDGALGEGSGKWRLVVGSDQPVFVLSLMASESGHLTNLSTVPANKERGDGETVHHVPLFLSAADAFGRQGFVRVVNKGAETASVRVRAHDGGGEYPTSLRVPGNGVAHFNSHDLEMGSADKGIEGVGSGSGDWRLELATDADVDVLAYVRHEDGFLTNMHDLVAATAATGDGVYRYAVATFNPGSNRNQASSLLLANSGARAATVTIAGVDDRGLAQGRIDVVVPAGRTVTLSAADLESGGEGFDGRLGDGAGKWRLDVASSGPLWVMNLLESATGRLTNLSSVPGGAE